MTRINNRVGKEYNDFCIIVGEPTIEEHVWIGYFTLLDGSGGLRIGRGSTISSGVHIYTHDSVRQTLFGLVRDHETYSHIDRSPVSIGENTFIGANSTVLKGVRIGDWCIIGANTLVNRNVPSSCSAYGNPMKVNREHMP